jgi:hypothetical protein
MVEAKIRIIEKIIHGFVFFGRLTLFFCSKQQAKHVFLTRLGKAIPLPVPRGFKKEVINPDFAGKMPGYSQVNGSWGALPRYAWFLVCRTGTGTHQNR